MCILSMQKIGLKFDSKDHRHTLSALIITCIITMNGII